MSDDLNAAVRLIAAKLELQPEDLGLASVPSAS